MKHARHFASREIPWFVFLGLAVLFLHARPLAAQPQGPAKAATSPSADLRAVVNIDGPWKFQIGDDPRWSDPAFDDSNWPTVSLSQSLALQGYPTYSGYAWYRIHLSAQQLAQFFPDSSAEPLHLLATGDAYGQLAVYVNGIESGHTRGMTDSPSMYQASPIDAQLSSPDASGSRVLAIRTWAGPGAPISRGLLVRLELGPQSEVAGKLAAAKSAQWNENAAAAVGLAFVFLGVALLGATLYLAQRHHSEYLWLAILCAVAAAARIERAALGLALLPFSVYWTVSEFTAYLFVAVTIEFVFRFTGGELRRPVRAAQIAALVAPFLHFLGISALEQLVSVATEAAFCAIVTVLLFRAWRRGRGDAGVMLVPFFLAAISDWINTVLDFVVGLHWLPQHFASLAFHIGPIKLTIGNVTDVVFLSSVFAVILYRFIRVSEEEQRSTAEISAARSVQALLIPTQLPSNKNFMLESAYLPVNGVGGDFFQVLPLKDDSLLIVVGDVSGKGLQAAMNSSTLVGALRNELSHDPATVLDHLNHVLLGAVSSPGAVPGLDSAPCFATCLCARIYPDGTMAIANAGHLSPYRDGRELELPPGLPLGVVADSHYEQAEFQLRRGDRLVFLSDGVVEATNSEGELFGFERTQQVSNEPARYIAQTAQRFGQTDDITVVSLYVASRAAERTSEKALHTS
ncbi:MAG TPA: PP2C family protein-serine/threonine phosphatase [Terracidiphilus sp.]|nr:PP2C family protein-serine/threonine phosphatase [Terracidiphilus sp.]